MKGTTRGVREAADALRPLGDGTLTLFGEAYRLPGSGAKHAGPGDVPVITVDAIANELYWSLHCRVPSHAPHRYDVPATWGEVSAFGDQLARANAGMGAWQSGWTVRTAPAHGRVGVRAFGVNFTASVRDVRGGGAGAAARRVTGRRVTGRRVTGRRVTGRRVAGPVAADQLVAGAPVAVRVPNEYRNFAPGYYTALGNVDHDAAVSPTTRVYWNVTPEGAARLVAALTRRLNGAGIPFRYKTPNDPARFLRCDTGVLYLPRERFAAATRHLERVRDAAGAFLRESRSPFVKPLGPGVGAAHDPAGGTSFGAHRCGLLAEALLEPAALAAESIDARAAAVAEALERRGYDPARLYLTPGERDDLIPPGSRGRRR